MAISNQQSAISNQRQSIAIAAENTELLQHPPTPPYQKPRTSLFLNPRDIQGGDTNVPESNGGLLS
jgi:hypothetical protein